MKTDTKSCKEHDETKYSPIGQTTADLRMDPFVPGCRQNHEKGMKIEMNKACWTIMKKATFL